MIASLATFLFIRLGLPQTDFWQQTKGPGAGTIYCLAIASNGYIFAGTRGGLARSTDDGISWSRLNTGSGERYFTTIATYSNGEIFAGTTSGYIFHSSDNGESWSHVGLGTLIESIAINEAGHVFVGGKTGIFRSTDGGENWSCVFADLSGEFNIESLAINWKGEILAGFSKSYRGGVLYSTDNGVSWKESCLGPVKVNSLAIHPWGQVFAATDFGIYRSEDNELNWVRVNDGLLGLDVRVIGFDYQRRALAVTNNYDGTSYHSSLYRSSNNGASWERILDSSTQDWIYCFAANSAGHIFLGTARNGLYRSTDDGQSWTQVHTGLANSTIYSLAINSSRHIFALARPGLFRSTDFGESWDEWDLGWKNYWSGYLGIDTNGTIYTGVDSTDTGRLYRSVDNGESWTKLNIVPAHKRIDFLTVTFNGQLYAGVERETYCSVNSGTSWTLFTLQGENVERVWINSIGYLTAKTSNSRGFWSKDNGESWTEIDVSEPYGFYFSSFTVNSNGFIFASRYVACAECYPEAKIYRSKDDGASWTELNAELRIDAMPRLDILPSGIIVCWQGKYDLNYIAYSTDDGDTWTDFDSGLWDRMTAIAVDPAGYLFAGTDGAGVFRSTRSINPLPSSWSFTANTGTNASIAVPWTIHPTVGDRTLRTGDAIGAFFQRKDSLFCAGYGIWQEGQSLAITVWGDNDLTPLKNGFSLGEFMHYKIWDAVTREEYAAVVTYQTGGPNYFSNGIYVLSSIAGNEALGMKERTSPINRPTDFALEQNYPNPFNPSTTIEYMIPTDGHVRIAVHNLLGDEVAVLVDKHQSRGHYAVHWDAYSLGSGVYYYSIRSGNNSESKKCLLLK